VTTYTNDLSGIVSREEWDKIQEMKEASFEPQDNSFLRKCPDGGLYISSKIALLEAANVLNKYSASVADYLDVACDILMELAVRLEEGAQGRRNNDEIVPAKGQVDPLANSLLLRIKSPKQIYYAPEIADILSDVGQALRIFRQSGSTEDFFETLASPFCELAPKRLRNRLSQAEADILLFKKIIVNSVGHLNGTIIENHDLRKQNAKLRERYKKLKKFAYSRHGNSTPKN
jgi:hypothetical protein